MWLESSVRTNNLAWDKVNRVVPIKDETQRKIQDNTNFK